MPVQLHKKTPKQIRSKPVNNFRKNSVNGTFKNGLFAVDESWTVKYWNKASEEISGVRQKDIVGKNLLEKFTAIISLNFFTVCHKANKENCPVHFKEFWAEKDAWFDAITWRKDDFLYVSFKISSHMMQKENPDSKLQALTELYRSVTEVTNDCLWEWDLQNREIFWIDGGHKRVFGYPVENALIPQIFWESCLHPCDKAGLLERLKKAIASGDFIWEDEYRFQKSDGSYAFVQDRGHIFYDNNKKALKMIGATHDISKRVSLENELVQKNKDRQTEVTSAVLTALENERAEIGKELHDNLNQMLAAAKMYLQMSRKNNDDHDIFLDKAYSYIGKVIEGIRTISKKLVIPDSHIIGLVDNIKSLVSDLDKIDPVKIKFQANGIVENDLSDKLQMTIYRIIQEQLNNILKHAHASEAAIILSQVEDKVILHITDNGVGYDMLRESSGVGIINIRSRVELCSGSVSIVSKPGEGYALKVILPLTLPVTSNSISSSVTIPFLK